LTASASARDTVITIADTGVGIEEGHIATLVKPFERGRIDPYVSRGGVGLGLAITRSLVELHDGTLAITSQPGKGTTVTVRLPNDNV
jgi:signal transduction histidine kinase